MVRMQQQTAMLTLDFLQSKLKQAESDISMYQLMIAEVTKLQGETKDTKKQNDFLKVITNKGNNNVN